MNEASTKVDMKNGDRQRNDRRKRTGSGDGLTKRLSIWCSLWATYFRLGPCGMIGGADGPGRVSCQEIELDYADAAPILFFDAV